MTPPPRLVPDRPSDAAIAQAFREFGGKSPQDSPTSSLGAYGWMFRRASEIDTATTVAVDHGMTCSDMEVAYDCAQQVIADQKARIERLESLLFAEQNKDGSEK